MLNGRRVVLRCLTVADFEQFRCERRASAAWVGPWEPVRPVGYPDPAEDRAAFTARCAARHRDAQLGTGFGFGVFVNERLCGEINMTNVVRGASQSAHVGYWMSRNAAGNGYMPESLVALCAFAFEEVALHRLQVAIIPRNQASLRVVEKVGLRCEGLAERYVQIAGRWEDHLRFAITSEEWDQRGRSLRNEWLGD